LLNDLDDGSRCTFSRFADDAKLGSMIDVPDGSAAWTGLGSWIDTTLTKLITGKCEVVLLQRSNPRHYYRIDTNWLESSSVGKDLGVLVNNKLTMH